MRRYGYLFEQLVRRELRQKYKGSVVGVLWYLVNPLVLMAIYGVMLGPLLKAVSQADYPIFILAGLLVWLFFAQSLVAASTSLVDQQALITKVAFPRETIPAAAVVVQLVPFFTMLVVLLPISLGIRGNATPWMLLLPVVIVCLVALTLGLSLVAAALHAYFRDVQPILNAAMLPWFFVSGVLFDLATLPGLSSHAWLRPLLRWVNPIAPFIQAFRALIYGGHFPGVPTMVYLAAAGGAALALGVGVFRRLSPELAVVI
jgi:ABC-type polysaccharide/polyol phosphate export permease